MTDQPYDPTEDPDSDPTELNPRTGQGAEAQTPSEDGQDTHTGDPAQGEDPDSDPQMLNPRDTRGEPDTTLEPTD